MRKIDDLDSLQALYGAPPARAITKVTRHLTPSYRAFIDGARFCVLSTVGAEGVHATPRGDDGPVVRIADDKTLLMPDWRGNNRLDGLRDIVTDGRAALLFFVPGSKTTLRVNARAWLTDDAAVRASFQRGRACPATVIVFEIQEVYSQCAKALLRSDLWNRDDAGEVPTAGEMIAETAQEPVDVAEYDASYAAYAATKMW